MRPTSTDSQTTPAAGHGRAAERVERSHGGLPLLGGGAAGRGGRASGPDAGLPPLADVQAPAAPQAAQAERARRWRRRAAGWVGNLALAAGLLLAAVMIAPAALGYDRYVISGGSMSGSIPRGALAFAEEAPVSELRSGDVITYAPPPVAGKQGLVTHRIVWAGRDRSGARAFRTKGDANVAPDPWQFTLTRPTQARYSFHVPLVGYAFALLSIPEARFLLLGLPALLVGAAMIARLWRDAGAHARREAAGAAPPA